MNISLQGKNAIICGSTQGIGRAAAIELAQLGASCILLARNEESLQQVTLELDRAWGQQHEYCVVDFADTEMVKETARQIVSSKTIHILINNTGGPKAGPIIEAAEEEFTKAFQQHLVNNHHLTQAVVPGMKQAGFGRIINIISTSVKTPLANLGVSNTIRAAVASWAKTVANELGQFSITVNSVLPGYTDTQRLRSLIDTNARRRGVAKDVIEREMMESIPVKRFGDASEIAAVIAFLASPAASFVNGVSIPVDGGKTGTI
jgi:3-oxoacyl-[acyl-carrier protein] reductase